MEKKSKEGPPLYIESLLSGPEYAKVSKIFPNTWQSSTYRGLDSFAPNEFKCRYRMGGTLNQEEITIINKRLDEVALLISKTLKA